MVWNQGLGLPLGSFHSLSPADPALAGRLSSRTYRPNTKGSLSVRPIVSIRSVDNGPDMIGRDHFPGPLTLQKSLAQDQ